MRKRAGVVLCVIAVLFAGIAWHLNRVSQGGVWLEAAVEQSSRTQILGVARGTIYDRYLQPLVNRNYSVMASVTPYEPMLQTLEQHGEEAACAYVKQLAHFGERVIVPLSSWLPPTSGIAQVWVPDRYGSDALAPHLIGYINGNGEGVCGVEKEFDEVLSRYSGEASVTYRVDALGRAAMQGESTVQNTLQCAKSGVVLTLDVQIQAIVQSAASRMLERGAVLVSSAKDGEVLASVSLPLFDPDHVENYLSQKDSPLLDRTRINYDLGSVFKLITAAAALENGISADKTYTCSGSCRFQNTVIFCHNPLGDGELTMSEALARSCNCYFMQLAKEVGAAPILELARRAGFDKALAPEGQYATSRALLPSKNDLEIDAALANFSIGQGTLMASVYHIQALMTSLVSDGMWSVPSIYSGEIDENGSVTSRTDKNEPIALVSASTASVLCGMLKEVVACGTGTAASPSSLAAAGKTGTAQTGWEIDGQAVVQSWFTGCYPADAPQYVITVLSENGGTNGHTAAPLFAVVCDELFQAGLVEKPLIKP